MKFLLVVCGPWRDVVLKEHGDFAFFIKKAIAGSSCRALLDDITMELLHLYDETVTPPEDLSDYAGVFLSGSCYNVTDGQDWCVRGAAWLRTHIRAGSEVPEVPMMGICYGHHLMAVALGGAANWNPKGLEWGTFNTHPAPASADDLLMRRAGVAGRSFPVSAYHHQTVTVLPPTSQVIFSSDLDDHQMLRHAPMVYSTQFHPEAYPELFHTYAPLLPFDSDAHRQAFVTSLVPTPESESLVWHFVALAVEFRSLSTVPRTLVTALTERSELIEAG